ncbi:transposase [Ferrovum myxofaciens]|uniref:Transposase n=2 Tax=root TaxID=1 RepID=A0A9E6SY95_9PROT|nr:transposase [Ferrovum myxofaciens]MBU6993753.1 transposase [Ferrovum myxofaciens]QSH81931.1 MAG: transposase [Ferrovum myxofaciens]QWY75525.1 MAG: transposase [Ferrovum myxofaciens]QWY78263.1 MAG: transposase [Ferrovum myxofaciens]
MLIIDDTLVPRCAKKGPGISVKHDHSHKANRPTFLNSQGWVTLALVVRVRLGSALNLSGFPYAMPHLVRTATTRSRGIS